ncbi:MAG: hypothetical protein IKU28_02040 [Erysipelotrichaceae bacterium]|nr:hypothetical protein [Erysipelotrichaceae bacterium]
MMKLLLALVLALAMCGCGASDTTALENKIAKLEKENAELKAQLANQSTSSIVDNTTTTQTTISSDYEIGLNETVSVGELMEFTLTSSQWTEEILPSNTSGAYSYYGDEEQEKYFVVTGTLTSYAAETFDIERCSSIELLINDKYKVSAVMTCEENDGTGFNEDIKSLQTLNMVIYAKVSDQLQAAAEKVQVTIKITTDESRVTNRFDEDYSYETYTIQFSN